MITLDFPGMKPAAKARPRVTGNGTYMPHVYRDWKQAFVVACVNSRYWQMNGGPLSSPCAVSIQFRTTTGNMRPDVDNAAGSCLDALQDAGVIANDSQVRRLLVEVVKAPKGQTGITVRIETL